jgi:von Willebrand factor A domain-containing protein 8
MVVLIADTISIHKDFTVFVLANRPGRLFHGNDFFREVGDCFSTHVVPNPDIISEVQLLQSYAPSVSPSILQKLAASFGQLRAMFEHGDIAYPYSTREAVGVAKHLEKYPDDDIVTVLHNVLDLDSFDPLLYSQLGEVFRNHGIPFQEYEPWRKAVSQASENSNLRIEYDRKAEGASIPPPLSSPKSGKWDVNNDPHVGGNQWAGGTGGSDTAGLGGRGGPYRLDRGHKVHQVSDEAKSQVSDESKALARNIARKALQKRLEDIGMSEMEFESYTRFLDPIAGDISTLRALLQAVESKNSNRDWIKNQVFGDLDDSRLIEGVAGEKNIYKRRGLVEPAMRSFLDRPQRLRFVVDCSGSMYRFNGYDDRLSRCLQASALVMESFEGMEDRFDYSIVGHSGDSRCIDLVGFRDPPSNAKERMRILQKMVAHSQYCQTGDNTLGAITQAVSDMVHDSSEQDGGGQSIVIAVSDANLERYGISPRELGRAVTTSSESRIKVFCIFIASFGNEAENIRRELPLGRGFVCMQTKDLPKIVRNILASQIG